MRKVHQTPTPLLGGLAIYGALMLALVFFSHVLSVEFGAIAAGATWLAPVGSSRLNGMKPVIKLGGQLIAGAVLIAAGIQVRIFASGS